MGFVIGLTQEDKEVNMYHNYRTLKAKGLAKVNKRTTTRTVAFKESEIRKEEQVSFDLEITKFNENDGTKREHPERHEIDIEALEKEKVLLQGFIEDVDEVLADIEALKE